VDFLGRATHCDDPLKYTVGIIYTICSNIKSTFFCRVLNKIFCMFLIIMSYLHEEHSPFDFRNVVAVCLLGSSN
jgi:hypothetical protein